MAFDGADAGLIVSLPLRPRSQALAATVGIVKLQAPNPASTQPAKK